MKRRTKQWTSCALLLTLLIAVFAGALPAAAADQTTSEGISAFPASYQSALKALQAKHPNWKFVAFDTGLNWADVITGEQSVLGRNLIPTSYKVSQRSLRTGAYNWATNTWTTYDTGRYYMASDDTVGYYMDPRNSLIDERRMFQFEQLSYNAATQTEAGVKQILKGTFMEDTLLPEFQGMTVAEQQAAGAMTFAQAFMRLAQETDVSPYHLAARVRNEQGVNGSSLCSGTYPGYEGYYNYFNVGASGNGAEQVIKNGLQRAKDKGWNTGYKSLLGGAQLLANSYIGQGQNTLYFEKFDVVQTGGLYSHQYMQLVLAAYSESLSVYNSYSNMSMLDASLTFVIPVYRNMPSTPVALPTDDRNPNYKLDTLGVGSETAGDPVGQIAITTGAVNMHTYAGSSYIVMDTLPAGTGVTVKGVVNGWYWVEYNSDSGYIPAGSTQLGSGVTTRQVDMHTYTGSSYIVLDTLPVGYHITVKAVVNGWYWIEYKGETGYIPPDSVRLGESGCVLSPAFQTDQTEYQVQVNNDVTSVTVSAMPYVLETTTVTGTGKVNLAVGENVVRVVSTAENGTSRTYTLRITRLSAGENIVAMGTLTASTSMHTYAGTQYIKLTTVPAGSTVSILGEVNGWYRVIYGEYSGGYIQKAYVKTFVPAAGLSLNHTSLEGKAGGSETLTATMTPANTTSVLQWKSSNPAVATVSGGKISGVGTGTAVITAYTDNGLSVSCTVTVREEVLFQGVVSVSSNLNVRDKPTSSGSSVIGSLPNGTRISVLEVNDGWYRIDYNGKTGWVSGEYVNRDSVPATGIQLSAGSGKLKMGETVTLTSVLTPAYTTDTVRWSTSNAQVATVENGKIVTVGTGTATITATAGSVSATYALTVYQPATSVTLNPPSGTLEAGASLMLNVLPVPANTTDTFSWSTSNSKVATVTNGKVTAVAGGSATITVTASSGVSASFTLKVTQAATSITLSGTSAKLQTGETVNLTATVSPATTTDTVSWSTSDAGVVTVSGGKVTAVKTGTAVITAKTSNGLTATCTVTVEDLKTGVTTRSVTMHTYTGTSYIVMDTLPKGYQVTILKVVNGWYWIQYNGDTGYIPPDSVQLNSSGSGGDSGSSGDTQTVGTTIRSVTMHTYTGTSYIVMDTLPKGYRVTVLKVVNGWYWIQYNGDTGYIPPDSVQLDGSGSGGGSGSDSGSSGDTQPMGTTIRSVTMHTYTGTSYIVMDTLPKGYRVTVLKVVNGWYWIQYNGDTGYIPPDSVQLDGSGSGGSSQTTTKVTTANLNLRTGAGTSYSRILTIPTGKTVTVLGTSSSWTRVKYNGYTGYVSSSYLR